MHPLPFKPSLFVAALCEPAGGACVAPISPPPLRRPQRARLAELDPQVHCSLLGTCLSSADLRRLVPRFKLLDHNPASDLELHHAAVTMAMEGGAGAKALNKLLDERHLPALRRFAVADSPQALTALWNEALRGGAVPGAYWAVMTHALATPALRQRAFGDVHMLSHLVGAANHADIRRLVALEQENAGLKEQVERQQRRLCEAGVERQQTVGQLNGQMAELAARLQRKAALADAAPASELAMLRRRLNERDEQLARHTGRREQAEQANAVAAAELQRLAAELARSTALAATLHAELHALQQQVQPDAAAPQAGNALAAWAGRRVLYVGGRPSSNATIRALCERAGVELLVHDGGIEDRKGLLPAAVPGSELVLFPVDCVDHDSMARLKKLCSRHGVPFKPLRTAGVASVVAALSDAAVAPARSGAACANLPCPRHG